MNDPEPRTAAPVERRTYTSREHEYPTVLVCMIEDHASIETGECEHAAGRDFWRVTASFLERKYKVYFADRRVLERVREISRNVGKNDVASCKARVIALRGVELPPGKCGIPAFFAHGVVA